MQIYKHQGKGHYTGSKIIVIAHDEKFAELIIRAELDSHGLKEEPLNIRHLPISSGLVICSDSGSS